MIVLMALSGKIQVLTTLRRVADLEYERCLTQQGVVALQLVAVCDELTDDLELLIDR